MDSVPPNTAQGYFICFSTLEINLDATSGTGWIGQCANGVPFDGITEPAGAAKVQSCISDP